MTAIAITKNGANDNANDWQDVEDGFDSIETFLNAQNLDTSNIDNTSASVGLADLASAQTLGGAKTFSALVTASGGITIGANDLIVDTDTFVVDAGTDQVACGMAVSGSHRLLVKAPGSGNNAIYVQENGTTQTVMSLLEDASDSHGIFRVYDGSNAIGATVKGNGILQIKDGITAPVAAAGFAQIYVDTADGDLKVMFGDGTVATIATDT